MACSVMHNSDNDQHNQSRRHQHLSHHHHFAPVSPRISFSNDFAESQHMMKQERSHREAPVSSDFEFSVSNHSMMSADELFFKGRLLPFKERTAKTTLREELLAGDDDDDGDVLARPPKGAGRWKGFLGLRKSHIGSKKAEKCGEASFEAKRSAFGMVKEDMHYAKNSQETMNEEGSSSCRDE